ncbi:thymidine kinase [Swingsia samuiensis]|uniref:Thymidine kinase n=1 Tax=Swingsia samuiensis TaxID=1293412 RepID=A0A4Y6UFP3_9PROT|nr:thymidine kinase [Swingsia samuiensis]QDH16373.1 thymidine kinase [Swingsia samuiensis]
MNKKGRLELYVGPMFSGKSAHLLAIAEEYPKALILKPVFDTRDGSFLASRNGIQKKALSITKWPDIARYSSEIILDEFQFMTAPYYQGNIIAELESFKNSGGFIAVAGLDTDYQRKPFSVVRDLSCIADDVVHLKAECSVCSHPASWTAKILETGQRLQTGDQEMYQARCDRHWSLPR